MCGIIGIIAKKPVADELVGGLKRLEYRGYDSAGIATLINGRIERRRAEGKLSNLVARLEKEPVRGTIGIGHTRWATHGQPSEKNAHPIATDKVAVVHNGIIENFQALKKELVGLGYSFQTDTDTEAVANLVTHYLSQGLDPTQAVAKTLERLEGAFALVFLFAGKQEDQRERAFKPLQRSGDRVGRRHALAEVMRRKDGHRLGIRLRLEGVA